MLDLFRAEVDRELSFADRTEMARRVIGDPFAYTKRYPTRFNDFRRAGVSKLVQDVAQVVPAAQRDAHRRGLPGHRGRAREAHAGLAAWLARGDLDAACPMIYTTEAPKFEEQTKAAVAAAAAVRSGPGWALGTDAPEIARRVGVARSAGASGVVFFSHHSLRDIAGVEKALVDGPFALRARRLPEM